MATLLGSSLRRGSIVTDSLHAEFENFLYYMQSLTRLEICEAPEILLPNPL